MVITFRRLKRWEMLAFRIGLFPTRRRAWEAKLRENIRWIVAHPDVPVRYED